jgi:hypothetical protein
MNQAFLDSLEPDGGQLLSEISEHITDDMLEEIALADYGQGQEEHLAALRLLRDSGAFVEPMHWYPCEVLELIRYSQPDDSSWKPGSPGVRGHWMRAFVSAALLRALGPPWEYKADAANPSFTLIQLIYSLRALPTDLEGTDEQVIFKGVGLLWLALHRNPPPPDRDLVALSEWIVRRESELARLLPGGFDRWLLGILGSSPPPSPWESLGLEFCSLDLRSHQRQLQEWVKLIGSELVGDSAS